MVRYHQAACLLQLELTRMLPVSNTYSTPSIPQLTYVDNPYRALQPSPASNYGGSRSLSPSPASVRPKSPMTMKRSATTAVSRSLAPHSPDLPSNMDCAFPPFPSKSATPRSAKPQTRDLLELSYPPRHAEPSPLFAPFSPQFNGGENIKKRMDLIAPGPFDGRGERRPSASTSSVQENSTPAHRRNDSHSSTGSNKGVSKPRTSWTSIASRSSTYSSRSTGVAYRGTYENKPATLPPSNSKTSEGIDAFMNRLHTETVNPSRPSPDKRSNTYPVRQDSIERRDQYRSNNEPASRNPSRPSFGNDFPQNTTEPTSRQPTPLVVPTFGNDTSSNSMYTPSDSGLSDDSYASSGLRSIASSRSSPPGSIDGHSRDISKGGQFDDFAKEPLERSASPEQYIDTRPSRGPGSFNRPNGPRPVFQSMSSTYSDTPDSPMDPAIQMGVSFDERPKVPFSQRGAMPSRERSPQRQMSGSRSRQPESRQPRGASKGNCRGCSESIVGKSVKDSSGRLTGRYHKQCFTCRTCGDFFPTAEFYVFENFPYCEQDYHKLNGSLCNWCDRGIEGQYLETDMRQKFHPRCFTCTTCRIVLQDDYYEVGGQKFCDRHAQHAAAPAPSYLGPGVYKGRNVQKRRTRLMMMT